VNGGLIHGIAFADDGRHLITYDGNGTVYILRLNHAAKVAAR